MSQNECEHVDKETKIPYKNIFCPDCGERLVWDYKAQAFKLRGR